MSALHATQRPTMWRKLRGKAGRFSTSTALLILLTAGVLLGVWKMDLIRADTASYFRYGFDWSRNCFPPGWLAYSPLYCAFLGLVERVFPDAGAALIIHRVTILLVIVIAMLAALRRILPRAWAWLVAAWWIASPINWRAFFEVHLFCFALVVIACACAGLRSAWGRGMAFALLLADGLLVRNELLPAAALFGGCCLLEAWRRSDGSSALRRAVPLVSPLAAVALLVVSLFSADLAQIRWKNVKKDFDGRQRLALQQSYCFGYKERHTDWNGEPWRGGAELMRRQFLLDDPTIGEAIRANPRAMLEHAVWNLRLIPAGIQLALFNSCMGPYPPDFHVHRHPWVKNPMTLSLLIGAIWCAGAALVYDRWRRGRLFLRGSPALRVWATLLCCVPSAFVAMIAQRPRTSYIFPFSLLLMAFTALSLRLLLGAIRRRLHLRAALTKWIPAVPSALAFLILPGAYWSFQTVTPLLDDYHRLHPFSQLLAERGRRLCASMEFPEDLADYLSFQGNHRLRTMEWSALLSGEPGASLNASLEQAQTTDLFLKDAALSAPAFQAWRAKDAVESGWELMAFVHSGAGSWEFWSRPVPPAKSP